MITILWTEHGGDRWEQVDQEQADLLMDNLHRNANIKDEDIIIFFEDAFGCSSYGDTYNIPNGTEVRIINEQLTGVILNREVCDIGVSYTVSMGDRRCVVYDRNLEIIK